MQKIRASDPTAPQIMARFQELQQKLMNLLFPRFNLFDPDREVASAIRQMSTEIHEERETLRRLMLSLGFSPSQVGATVARVGEWFGRFKPNGHVLRRSPLTDMIELEALRDAVSGKRVGWQVLREVAEVDPRIDLGEVDRLLAQAESQLERLQDLHLRVVRERLLG